VSAPLVVRDLEVGFKSIRAVRGVSFDVADGEVVGIVGESGSGKSTMALAIMGLSPETATVTGSIEVDGIESVGAKDSTFRHARGSSVSMIFQDPMTALNPVKRIGQQVEEAILVHQRIDRRSAKARAKELLRGVGIPDVEERFDSFPHEFSGGMRQRVVIAIAMANSPRLIIADEPTTALDVTVQAQVLAALQEARRSVGAAMMLVTHDLAVVAGSAHRVAVMYAGRIVEIGTTDEIFYQPRMPYTRGLLGATSSIAAWSTRLTPIPGTPPAVGTEHVGCPFADRCAFVQEICRTEEPALLPTTSPGHQAACHFRNDYDYIPPYEPKQIVTDLPTHDDAPAPVDPGGRELMPLFEAQSVSKSFTVRRGRDRRKKTLNAVADVSFELSRAETFGLVGESGCGKSTLSRCLVQLEALSGGRLVLNGEEISSLGGKRLRDQRRRVQMVFQDPSSSLDPRQSVEDILAEPLRLSGVPRRERSERAAGLLESVGLSSTVLDRFPHQLSGGQQQRVGIARALATDPDVLVLDEPVSALDVSVQASVLNLLKDLVRDTDRSQIFIAHDLSVVAYVSDRVAVMYLGRIVELGNVREIIARPRHPYTQALLSAVPVPDPITERERVRIPLRGDPPSPIGDVQGCPFRTRCPVFANMLSDEERQTCIEVLPELSGSPHPAACHYPQDFDTLAARVS
jgi:peptide/nickel transport system ATP-binding protein